MVKNPSDTHAQIALATSVANQGLGWADTWSMVTSSTRVSNEDWSSWDYR